ncbi:MAG: Asp23/Gls24 family envelope stress response protein [Anaerolineales bacterium]|nr:Asp23/Gls24 family envelope stress response protein [Anaerolineales bacterium]
MSDQSITPGKTTISIDVILTIARLTTLEVPGVSRMSTVPSRRFKTMLLHRQEQDGLHIEVVDDLVYTDLYVILEPEVNIREVGRNIQIAVARAITEMIGMQVGIVNVHIEDIDYPDVPEVSENL